MNDPIKQVDWPVLIKYLQAAGMTQTQLAEKTGMSTAGISQIASEKSKFRAGDQATSLLMLFMKMTNKDVPIVGDHHKIMESE